MADFNALEALINAHIKKNGVQAITGNILNGILRSMVSALGKGYTIAGVAVPSSDPGTMTGPLAYLAYTAGTYTHFGGLEVGQGEVSMLIYNEAEWHKEVLFVLSATATVDDNVGTPEVGVSFVDGLLTFDFRNMKGNPGNDGDAAGFGTINATVDGNVGTPGVSVQSSGPDTAKNITFQFTNLKGETGVTSVVATVDNTVGTPTCTVSLVGQQLTLAFSGLKGAQGDTGSSVDYPFTIVNNLTTNDATQALSAAMGVQLESEVSQLEAKVTDIGEQKLVDVTKNATVVNGKYVSTTGAINTVNNWEYLEIGVTPGEKYTVSAVAGLSFRLWLVVDGNGTVLALSSDSSAVSYKTETITIPATATKLYVNARQASIADTLPTIEKDTYTVYSDIVLVGNESITNYVNKKIDYTKNQLVDKKEDATIEVGKYVGVTGLIAPVNGWEYLELAVTPGEKYKISAVAGLSFRLWIVVNGAGVVIALSSDNSAVSYKTDTITIPATASKLYVNARQNNFQDLPPEIFLIRDVVDAKFVYVGDKPIKKYVDDELVGNPVHIFHYDSGVDKISYILSPFNATHKLKNDFYVRRSSSASGNPDFNFDYIYLVASDLQQTHIHPTADDITPANYNGSYLGGNHGDSEVRKITCSAHGKTFADIGSIWSNGSHDYTIVAIVDEDNLLVLGENLASYPLFSFAQDLVAGNTLTHISGATHTDPISVSASISTQFYSALRVQDLKIVADGVEISASGEYKFNHLDICEMYDVLNVASVLSLIQQGVGTFTENPNPNSFLSADKVARHSIVYGFDSAGEWRIRTDFIAYQDIVLNYFGFTQQGVLGNSGLKMYIPKALPYGGIDFRTPQDYTSLSDSVNLTSDYWENPNLPPDRWIQYNDYICIHSGYLFDYGVGGVKRKDFINNAMFLYKNTRKTYPHGIDSKITVSGGDVLTAVVWRSYMDLAEINSGGVIAKNLFEYDGKLYIYGDFNVPGIYEIEIPEKYIGKMISVFEKSANVTLLAGVANAKVLVKVDTASPMYGYLVAQIK